MDKNVDLNKYMRVVSLLAFIGIFMNTVTGWGVDKWADGLMFMIMGVALMIAGGIHMFFAYFKDGLTNVELTKMLTDIFGLIAIFTGLSIIFEWSSPIILGTRSIIALLAIIVIVSDMYNDKSKKKK
jgi:hypothetical protein